MVACSRPDEDERAHALGVGDRELERDAAAERDPDEGGALHRELVEDAEDAPRERDAPGS